MGARDPGDARVVGGVAEGAADGLALGDRHRAPREGVRAVGGERLQHLDAGAGEADRGAVAMPSGNTLVREAG